MICEKLATGKTAWMYMPLRPASKESIGRWKQYYDRGATPPPIKEGQNWGLLLGTPSDGLACRDFDGLAGQDAYQSWAAEYPAEAATWPTVKTGNGWHLYFHMKTEDIIKRTFIKLGDGELRLNRCYNVAPPSTHPSGRPYSWTVEPSDEGMRLLGFDDLILMDLIPNSAFIESAKRTSKQRGVTQRHGVGF